MLESIEGILLRKDVSHIALQTGGLGYKIHIPIRIFSDLPEIGKKVFLYVSLVIREEAHTLFGFLEMEDRDLFELLITLSGIGPKTALALLNHMNRTSLQAAVELSDVRLLSKVPGIGKKTAERLVIDLKDKLKKRLSHSKVPMGLISDPLQADAVSALMQLGYQPSEAQKAVEKVLSQSKEKPDLSSLIVRALQKF